MSIFKCKMCAGTIEFEQGATVGVCDHCGREQTLPRLDDERRANLYDRANHLRRNNEFDKAAGIYEQILNEDTTDAEAYWSLVLCNYGIEYVEDPSTHKRVPTVNRTQYTSVFDDDNYKSAIKNASPESRVLYESEAAAINEIQKGILAISQKEEPFDVFICYKETGADGRRTQDSVLANDLYHQLVREGFKVFFARITLEDKLGTAYEPYIFAALNSSKVMVVLGTKPEYFNAVWVKNEWSRFLGLVKKSGGAKTLIPAYRDMDPYDLPEEFSHLQAQDMSKLGFMQDLIRGIKKICGANEPASTGKETVVAPLLKRAFMFLEDGEWQEADSYCEKVLDQEPENAQAYLGKLMAELKVRKPESLANCAQPFASSNNFKKAVRFGDETLSSQLKGFIAHIIDRNENARLTGIYNNAGNVMKEAKTESDFKYAAEIFKTVPGFKDADSLAEKCLEKAEICRKDAIYNEALQKTVDDDYDSLEYAIKLLTTISGWRDSEERIKQCRAMQKDGIYTKARMAIDDDSFESLEYAIKTLTSIPGWRDSDELIKKCRARQEEIVTDYKDQVYNSAELAIKEDTVYSIETAIEKLSGLTGWKDSNELMRQCRKRLEELKDMAAKEAAEKKLRREREEEQRRLELIKKGKREKRIRAIAVTFKLIITFLLCAAVINIMIGVLIIEANETSENIDVTVKYSFIREIYDAFDGSTILSLLFYWSLVIIVCLFIRFVVMPIGRRKNGGSVCRVLFFLTISVLIVTFCLIFLSAQETIGFSSFISMIISATLVFGPSFAASIFIMRSG